MNKSFLIAAVTIFVLAACNDNASTSTASSNYKVKENVSVDMDSESEKFTYSLGMLIGTTLQNGGMDSVNYGKILSAFEDSEEDQIAYQVTAGQVQQLLTEEVDIASLDKDIIAKAIYDVIEGDTTIMNGLEVQQAYQTFLKNNQIKVGETNLEAGRVYLEANKNNEGVQVTETGLQHLLIEEGTGDAITNNDVIEVHYTGTSITGEEFDSSIGADPLIVDVKDPNSAIPGFMQSLKLYPMGSKYRIFVPSNLAYGGQRMTPEMGPNSTLVFDIELVKKLEAKDAREYRKQVEDYKKFLQQQNQGRR